MRDRLIELIKHVTSCEKCFDEDIADYLIANGVIVPPCKVGDTVYQVNKIRSGHWEGEKYIIDDEGEWKIYEKDFNIFCLNPDGFTLWKDIFLTREEAEKALKERERK